MVKQKKEPKKSDKKRNNEQNGVRSWRYQEKKAQSPQLKKIEREWKDRIANKKNQPGKNDAIGKEPHLQEVNKPIEKT